MSRSDDRVPEDFHPHAKFEALLDARRKMAEGEQSAGLGSWRGAGARHALCLEGRPGFAFTGQDVERGTFSHRHACCTISKTATPTCRSQTSAATRRRSRFTTVRSTETAVLGFEYGYSLGCPDGLVIWEAQFGDF